jgi:hypothetical protein
MAEPTPDITAGARPPLLAHTAMICIELSIPYTAHTVLDRWTCTACTDAITDPLVLPAVIPGPPITTLALPTYVPVCVPHTVHAVLSSFPCTLHGLADWITPEEDVTCIAEPRLLTDTAARTVSPRVWYALQTGRGTGVGAALTFLITSAPIGITLNPTPRRLADTGVVAKRCIAATSNTVGLVRSNTAVLAKRMALSNV